MSRSAARRRTRTSTGAPLAAPALAVTAVTLTLTLAGCGIGQGNETSKEHSVVQAAHVTIGNVNIENIAIDPVGETLPASGGVSLAPTNGTTQTPTYTATPTLPPAGSIDGYVIATVTNGSGTSSDAFQSAQIAGGATGPSGDVSIVPGKANVTVRPNGQLIFGDPADTQIPHAAYLVITNISEPLQIGDFVPMTFTMASGGQSVTVQVPVISSYYGPAPSTVPGFPSASPSSTATASPKTSSSPPSIGPSNTASP